MGTEVEVEGGERGLSQTTLAKLRGILVSSLSRENLAPQDTSPEPPEPPARRRRKVHFSESKSVDCLHQAGAAPESQRNTRPPPSAKPAKESAASQRDREERLRIIREKQNEERQKKLDELKQQALAAQKFREQKEEERRRRMEDLRLRDTDRRHQVEERKRQIWEAERDRREAILRKNLEREARIETKRKNERSQIVFAFGSSTPRMLEPSDTGGSYWATRRATSTSNMMTMSMSAAPGPLTRRSSERELDGSKKRATSASGINRTKQPGEEGEGEESGSVTPVAATRAARRKTDLLPTQPSPRDLPPRPYSARTPGRAYSMSRLDVLAQPRKPRVTPPVQERDPALSQSMSHLAARPLRRTDTSRSMHQLAFSAPVPPPRVTRAERLRRKARDAATSKAESVPTSPGLRSGEVTPSRPQSSLSQHSVASSMSSSVHAAFKPRATPRRPRPYSIAVTGISASTPPDSASARHSLSAEHRSSKSPASAPDKDKDKPPLPKVPTTKKPQTPKPEAPKKSTDRTKTTKSSATGTPKATPLQSPGVESASASITTSVTSVSTISESGNSVTSEIVTETVLETLVPASAPVVHETQEVQPAAPAPAPAPEPTPAVPQSEPTPAKETINPDPATDLDAVVDMTASMIAKTRITTEEEAKAALAEKRRVAREMAEREAELERQRIEAERLAEEQRLREEEEEQRRMEEEQLKLLEEARQAEQERLRQAIEEAQKREEEERLQKEKEAQEKVEKEEAEKKAREEAERQRQEMEIRLKKEEEDRLERKKRVEAIMKRTRGKGSTPANTPTKENGDESPVEEGKSNPVRTNEHEQFLVSERSHSAANNSDLTAKQNGHQNGVDNVVEQNNVTNNLLDLSIEGLGTEVVDQILTPSSNPTLATNGKTTLVNEDSVNFNTVTTPSNPFINSFQDNKKQDSVNDLL